VERGGKLAFWNQTQIEELQIENRKLTDQLAKCNRELIRYKHNEIIKSSLETERLQRECDDLMNEVKRLSSKLEQSILLEEYEEKIRVLKEQNLGLRKTIEHLRNLPRPHNERGAGRKSRVIPANVEFVKQARNEGRSLSEIAKLLSEESDKPWSKSTVKYILTKY